MSFLRPVKNTKPKITIACAQFEGNIVRRLTARGFADFRADAQMLANEIDNSFDMLVTRVSGEELTLRVKPEAY